MLELTVTDIKHYFYCPRDLYFSRVLPLSRRVSFKMEEGHQSHIDFDRLEVRRKLKKYGLEEGTRHFNLQLSSSRLALMGKLDMFIETAKGFFPVECKNSERKEALGHKYQLTAYAMLLEDTYNCSVRTGFLYYLPCNRLLPVPITADRRKYVIKVLTIIHNIIATERFPPPTPARGRCRDCEWQRYCNDRGG